MSCIPPACIEEFARYGLIVSTSGLIGTAIAYLYHLFFEPIREGPVMAYVTFVGKKKGVGEA
ncbi:hypothetical protein MUP07_00660 [Candidatus Bathyarchaeota archaeon]|nr:hypothetical protein [Candidatus Bathyarchaeota archaeon]